MKAIMPILAGASAALLAPLGPLLTPQPVQAQAAGVSELAVLAEAERATRAECTLSINAEGERLEVDAGEGCGGTAAFDLSGDYRTQPGSGTL